MKHGGGKAGIAWLVAAVLMLAGSSVAGQLRLPPDLVYKSDGSPGKVVFSHEFHTAIADKCTACHIQLFRMLRPTHRVSHADMEAGKSCGACHNGHMAFGPTEPAGCGRCHVREGKSS